MALLQKVKRIVQTAADLPKRRADGDLVKNIHPYRQLMPFIMPGRNESVCYYDDYVRAEPMLDYMPTAKQYAANRSFNDTATLFALAIV